LHDENEEFLCPGQLIMLHHDRGEKKSFRWQRGTVEGEVVCSGRFRKVLIGLFTMPTVIVAAESGIFDGYGLSGSMPPLVYTDSLTVCS
jgi:hypothetical protein